MVVRFDTEIDYAGREEVNVTVEATVNPGEVHLESVRMDPCCGDPQCSGNRDISGKLDDATTARLEAKALEEAADRDEAAFDLAEDMAASREDD